MSETNKTKSPDRPHFVGESGRRYYFDDIGREIKRDDPELVGKHIFEQLKALGLSHEFDGGYTSFSLPFTFTDEEIAFT